MEYHCGMADTSSERDKKLGFLKDEYLLIQKLYEDFDTRIMTIKGWSATIGLVAIGGGFYYSPYLWLFAAGIGLVFWTLEATWKSFQYNYSDRIELLEAGFRSGDIDKIKPFQIYTAWGEAFQSKGYIEVIVGNMGLLLVLFPHIVPVVAGPIIFFLNMHFHFAGNK
jgi:hypothetical protein